ncbi:thermonuclease family protein [Paenibacillus chartarius]|uniref:Thermonuclease family protein n=1 Tax=Paenibacillus chartarius TaxID=747481 RepID=A0ABV6DKM4_9BACL
MTERMFSRLLLIVTSIVLFGGLAAACGKPAASQAGRDEATVERIVDGDTLEVTLKGKKEKIRLIGVDTPETKKPNTPVMFYGEEASDFTKKRLQGKTVQLEWDVEKKDRYDRWLAYVWVGDELFNSTLLKEGYARLSTFPPNVKYVDRFKQDQESARKANKGLWRDYEAAFGRQK